MKDKVNFVNHCAIMRAVGGRRGTYIVISQALGRPYTTVASWAVNGIPSENWPVFIALAKSRGVEITADDLMMTQPRLVRELVTGDAA